MEIKITPRIQMYLILRRMQNRMMDDNFTTEDHRLITDLWSENAAGMDVAEYLAALKLENILSGEDVL